MTVARQYSCQDRRAIGHSTESLSTWPKTAPFTFLTIQLYEPHFFLRSRLCKMVCLESSRGSSLLPCVVISRMFLVSAEAHHRTHEPEATSRSAAPSDLRHRGPAVQGSPQVAPAPGVAATSSWPWRTSADAAVPLALRL